MPNGSRYLGFLGQPRPLVYEAKLRRQTPGSSTTLPHDITEGPLGPLRSPSAIRRRQEASRHRLNCPLVFDNGLWRINATKRRPSRLIKRQSSTTVTTDDVARGVASRPSSVVAHAPGNDKKFFDALLKPRVRKKTSLRDIVKLVQRVKKK